MSDAASVVAGLLAEARAEFERCLRARDEQLLTMASQRIDEIEAFAADGEAMADLDRQLHRGGGAGAALGDELDDDIPF